MSTSFASAIVCCARVRVLSDITLSGGKFLPRERLCDCRLGGCLRFSGKLPGHAYVVCFSRGGGGLKGRTTGIIKGFGGGGAITIRGVSPRGFQFDGPRRWLVHCVGCDGRVPFIYVSFFLCCGVSKWCWFVGLGVALCSMYLLVLLTTYRRSKPAPRPDMNSHAILICVVTRGSLTPLTSTSVRRVGRKVQRISTASNGLLICVSSCSTPQLVHLKGSGGKGIIRRAVRGCPRRGSTSTGIVGGIVSATFGRCGTRGCNVIF